VYDSFRIRRFKLFDDFRIEGLQRVNLITGRNNAGKTALLEALFLHGGAVNIGLPFSIERLRGVTDVGPRLESATAWLFTGSDTTAPIELEAQDERGIVRSCTLQLVQAPVVIPPGGSEEDSLGTGYALEMTFRDLTNPSRPHVLSSRAIRDKDRLLLDPPPRPPLYNGVFVTTRGFDHKADAARFSEMTKSVGEEEELVRALRIVDQTVKAVRLHSHNGITMIHLDIGLPRFLPLAYAGEGMARLAQILVAIGNSKNGITLIDEFGAGIHYSLLPKVWEAVAAFAGRFNAQLFATTHSVECIAAAHEVFSTRQYEFRLFRLDRTRDGKVVARAFDKEALDAGLKTELEIR